jgi:hypothetical protein
MLRISIAVKSSEMKRECLTFLMNEEGGKPV